MKNTVRAEATNFNLWQEYVDPTGEISETGFNEMSVKEKMEMIINTWPDEIDEADTEALEMLAKKTK